MFALNAALPRVFLALCLALGPQNAVRDSLTKQSWQTFRGAVQNFKTQLEDCRKHTPRCETGDCTLKGNFKHLLSVPATAPSRFSSVYNQRLVVPFPTAQPVAILPHDLFMTLSIRREIRILVVRQLEGEIYCLGISG
jgi:hypothetical protein